MYHIVADSGCDIFTLNNASFSTAALTISTDVKHYVDDETLDTKVMAEEMLMHKGRSFTACPSADAWMNAFVMKDGAVPDEIYVVTMTSGLSGTYNSAMLAKEMFQEQHPDTKILVVDSLSVGPEMNLILEKIHELKQNNLSFETVQEQIKTYCTKTRLFFALQSLHNLSQNGRVNKLVAAAAGVLGISAIGTASEKGDIHSLGKTRGDKRVVASLLKEMVASGYHGGKVRISHTENEPLARKLCETIIAEYPDADILMYPARGLCSYYCERGGLCVGCENV